MIKVNSHALCTIDSVRAGKQWRMGTGFVFLRRDWVVTSKHVIWDEENLSFREPIYLISTDPKIQEKRIEPKNYFFHPHIDLAIVETKNDMCKLPFFPAHQAFNDNHNVAAIGYSRSNSAFDKINFRAVPLKHVRTESRERECGPEESYEFEFEGSEPGNSGGPVFGDGAGVLAVICHGALGDSSNISKVRATRIHTIVDALDLKLNWCTAE